MLLATKLHPPASRPEQVVRRQLLARLHEALTYPLTLISAPAGFGKTTLLADFRVRIPAWATPTPGSQQASVEARHPQFCWLSLDEGDNDPTRFWSYVATALETVGPGIGQPLLDVLHAAAPQAHSLSAAPPMEALLTLLINELVQTKEHLVLVLDDYHAIYAQSIHDALQFLVDHQPNNLHLILLTRSDPPLPLARWRARGQLLELRMADLRFTSEEVAAFFTQSMGLLLTAEQLATLESCTEGWITGLQLAALALQGSLVQKGQREVADFIYSFTGSNRFVLDYLIDEVLHQQPESLQTFLLHTALLDRLTAPLCDALTDRQDSHTLLYQLEARNLFLIALDETRTWWRYHHLFADVLRSRLQAAHPDRVPLLHRRAADWLAQHGWLSEAIEHALAAADFPLAAQLIERNAYTLLKRGEHNTLDVWLGRLPLTVLDAHPQLLVVHAAVLVLLHQLDRAERDLEAAQQSVLCAEPPLRQRVLGEVAALRANIASQRDDLPQAISLAHQALAALSPEDLRLRGEVMYRLGVAHAWQGQVAEATQAYTAARQLAVAADDLHTALRALMNLAAMQSMQGHLPQALVINQQTLAWAAEQGVQHMPVLSMTHTELARLFYEFNDLATARRHLEAALQYSERGGLPNYRAEGHILMALVLQAGGDLGAAQAMMRTAEQLIEQYRLPLRYGSFALRIKLLLSLACGELAAASHWAQASRLTVQDELDYAHEEERVALAHLLVGQGHYAEAITFLDRLYQFAEAQGRFNAAIPMLALKAKALHLLGDRDQALATLARVLVLAAPGGYVRTFVDQGEPIRMLIAECGAQGAPQSAEWHAQPYIQKLLAAFPQDAKVTQWQGDTVTQPAQPPIILSPLHPIAPSQLDLLSARELEVLRLIDAGASNQQIAGQLIISLNTVKRHMRNIFHKLHVHKRTQAPARARELGLL